MTHFDDSYKVLFYFDSIHFIHHLYNRELINYSNKLRFLERKNSSFILTKTSFCQRISIFHPLESCPDSQELCLVMECPHLSILDKLNTSQNLRTILGSNLNTGKLNQQPNSTRPPPSPRGTRSGRSGTTNNQVHQCNGKNRLHSRLWVKASEVSKHLIVRTTNFEFFFSVASLS